MPWSLPGVKSPQFTAPGEDPFVRRHQTVTIECRGDDDAVGRIGVEVRQVVGANPDVPVDGDLDEAVIQKPRPASLRYPAEA